jgi:hypothetical protein
MVQRSTDKSQTRGKDMKSRIYWIIMKTSLSRGRRRRRRRRRWCWKSSANAHFSTNEKGGIFFWDLPYCSYLETPS